MVDGGLGRRSLVFVGIGMGMRSIKLFKSLYHYTP